MKEAIEHYLKAWLFYDKRCSSVLAQYGITALDPLVDPDTVKPGVYAGHVPFILPFSEIDKKMTQVVNDIHKFLIWGGENSFVVDIPLFDHSYVNDPTLVETRLELKMITGDQFDKLVFDSGHVMKYMKTYSIKECDSPTFDLQFALQNHLDIYVRTTLVEFSPGEFEEDTKEALCYFNTVLLKHFNDKLLGVQVTPTSA